jgi:hypothetical protein
VTQPGQTDGFDAMDHLRTLLNYTGPDAVDHAVFNSHIPAEDVLERYRKEGADIVTTRGQVRDVGVEVFHADLMEDLEAKRVLWEKQDLLRHHPDKLADAVCRIYSGLAPRASDGP